MSKYGISVMALAVVAGATGESDAKGPTIGASIEGKAGMSIEAEAVAEPVVTLGGDADGWVVERGSNTFSLADQCVSPTPVPPAAALPAGIGGGCFADRFFVEVPADRPDLPPAYPGELFTRLDNLKPQVLDWVCPDNDIVCRDLSNPLPLQVESVIDDRAWNIRFDVPVRTDKLCAAVAGVRSAASEAQKLLIVGPPGPPPFVGRQCAMRIMTGAQQHADPGMMDWHLDAMGVQPGGGVAPGPPVHLVVVDTGIRSEVGDTIGVTQMGDELDVGGFDPSVQIHPHGTQMALLVRQVSPSAHIYDLRVLSEQGDGAIADLAAAIEQIRTSDLFEVGPLVVNLSLGWAPELGRARDLQGLGCSTQEDPVGESVRWALNELAERDASAPTVVLAAAGNRPHRADLVDGLYAEYFSVAQDQGVPVDPHTTCPGPAQPSPDWFYPAEWNRRPTCDAAGLQPRYLTWAVGATDSRELPGALTIDAPETPLVAPGEHVYVEHGFSDAWPGAQCLGDGAPNLLTLPATLTGSSVSTALTSAAVAEAQSVRLRHGASAIDAAGLQRLVWLTGESISGFGGWVRQPWRPDPMGMGAVDLQRLSWCRLFHAVEESARMGGDVECVALVQCADPALTDPAAVIDGSVEVDCRVQADMCLGAAICNPPNPVEPQWPANYQAPAQCLTPEACPSVWADASPCEATPEGCDFERTIEQHSAAPVGPQPGTPTCPDCTFDVSGMDNDDSVLLAELNWQFQTGTTFSYPHLIVDYWVGATFKREYLAVPTGGPWEPGDYVKVTDLPDLPAGSGHKVSLWLYVDPPGPANATSDVSPLRLEF